ncbi:MAG: sigma-70 family RNA polymerase sigma factor [Myxococcales bacterium]|jgi:RNA polymerase sigma-70 factor (ECF subfamily)|nr:sigma-70 family RNA polymerase sigma factor [Myxococcales bacterium]MBL0195808.1 sigma-70 family RNA polymerase sigma factor [Myxococcales bacterium]HQY60444.1 sigma-70 family RNA polymerase sigma factor [Polyangiaceae bacterium]
MVPSQSLIDRARAGERAALEELLESVAPSIHRFGLRMCRNTHDADDVLQDTLLSVTKHLAEFEGRSSLTSWVFALTRSACARRRRGLKNQPPVSDDRMADEPHAGRSPEAETADHELGEALGRALDALPEEHREVVMLRDVEGLTAPETAEALGVSVDAVKSRLHRARDALRRELRPLLEAPAPAHAKPSTCPDVSAMWSRKLEGDLSQGDCAAMEAHLTTCPACASACDALRRALLACRHVSTRAVPPEVQARVKAAVRAWAGELTAPGAPR